MRRSSAGDRVGPRRALAAALAAAVSLALTRAEAQPSRVVLVERQPMTPAVAETHTRVRAELELAGFVVVEVAGAPATVDMRAELERIGAENDAIAAIAIANGGPAADVWITDRVTQKTVIRRVDAAGGAPGERPATVAIRAVELLRASLIEAEHPASAGGPVLPDDVTDWMRGDPYAAHSAFAGYGGALSIGLLQSLDGLGPAAVPALRLSYGSDDGFVARLAFAGPSVGPEVEGSIGSASLLQFALTGEFVYAPILDGSRVVPLASVGLGAYYAHAAGTLDDPALATSGGAWALAMLVGGGAGVRITENVTAVVDAALLFTSPRVVVAMRGEPLGSAGRPSLLATLGVLATLY